jgi:hypothetical protein
LYLFGNTRSNVVFARTRQLGSTVTRLTIAWSAIAPSKPPTRQEAQNPGYGGYVWNSVDRSIKLARANRLEPLITILYPPRWAREGPAPWKLDVPGLADFATAAARRYSGTFKGLPRVRYWMIWNEPNLEAYLKPQVVDGRLAAPAFYRRMLNAAADAVHSVRHDDVVVAGGLAPFTHRKRTSTDVWGTGPLPFMRAMLCLSKQLRPICKAQSKFDAWAHHPYTSGNAFHHAYSPDDVSLGDLPEMRGVLDAAARQRLVVSPRRPQFWVTEFCWDSNPPDRHGVPIAVHARWVAEALYQMWRSGVSLVTWISLRDAPPPSPVSCGFYFASGRAKPSLTAYRFPFVAYPRRGRIFTWGRTPWGRPARVRIEQRVRRYWRLLGTVSTNPNGIFTTTLTAAGKGDVRARLLGRQEAISRPFSLKRQKPRFPNPFGEGP